MFALGLLSWLYHRPDRGHDRVPGDEVRQEARDRRPPTWRRSAPAGTSARPPRPSRSPTRSSRPRCRRAPTATSPATWRWPTAWSPPRTQSGLPLFLGAYPITPASDILHELQQAQALRRAHLPGRGRDRRHRRGPRRLLRRRAGRHHHLRPRHRAQGRDHRPGGEPRAAAGHRRRPARRPDHRPADQDRAVRPAAGHVRPQRRGAGPDRRAPLPRRLLRRRDRGRAHRGHLPHAGVPAVRRLPGQRLRAVADPGRRRPARSSPPEFATEPNKALDDGTRRSGPSCATPRPWPGPGRSPARRAWSTASAASRRPTAPATSPTTRTTTT